MCRIVVMLMLFLVVGCGGASDKPQLAPVSGVVMMDGKPLEGVTVGFHLDAETAPRPGIGKTDANGKFRITTYDTNDGAIIGTHIVTVARIDAPEQQGDMEIGGDAYGAAMLAAANPDAAPPKQLFPEKFAKKETSPLKVTVDAAGKSDVQLTLE